MISEFKKIFKDKDMPGLINIDAKTIKWIAIGLGATIATVVIWRKVKKASSLSKERQTQREAERQVVKSDLTYDDYWYKQAADRLFAAMSGAGTQEKTIYSVIDSLKTKSDWYRLVSTFGMRESKARLSKFKGNLISWLEDELKGREMNKVSEKLSKINVTL